MTNFNSVKKFMEVFGQEVKIKAEFPSEKIIKLRYSLIKEELDEFEEALKNKDLKEVADALTDILYVTYGAGHAFGIDLDKCFDEVQRSNMSKLGDDGKPIYNEHGKVMKGPKYFQPNLGKFIK
ncbi:nucleoside triphosphate pyrophosphohydrolase family protein [Pelagibacteraceae bacterium]|nr:nucleoside triphosphate pyrophosphohydrolase family protein [Pelagibacteraceae bacterium]